MPSRRWRSVRRYADLGTDHLPTCVDPEGCPLACRVFDALKEAIAATPALNGKVGFVTLSFGPARDTREVMRRYAGSRAVDLSSGLRWYFLTTRSARELMRLVEGFGQDVRVTYERSSAALGASYLTCSRYSSSIGRRRARDLQLALTSAANRRQRHRNPAHGRGLAVVTGSGNKK